MGGGAENDGTVAGSGDATSLARIAAAFSLSAAAFGRVVRSEQEPPVPLEAVMEAAALQDAFARIADPGTRRRCLALVEAAARDEAAGIRRVG